jgi:hypothetical protein
MTGREWQHGLYIRDRWTVSPKITLDLGMRWEYYPIMHRADRGIEILDLNTLDVILGGKGGNPDNVGLKASKDNFAPRVGVVYRMNEQTVIRTGYGVTYNPLPWARPLRGDASYPVVLAQTFTTNNNFGYFSTLADGIPAIITPDSSSGRVRLANSATMRTPEPGNVDRGTIQSWNLAFERKLPLDISLDVAYVGTKGDGGYGDLDINAPSVIGSGNAGRPYASFGRNIAIGSWGQRLRTRYHSLQTSVNRPFTKGVLLKGAYTWGKAMNESQNDEDGRATYFFNSPSELQRNYALAGFDRTHNFQMGFLYQLPWQSANGGYGNFGKALISDWQVNGVLGIFSGAPFTLIANGASVNTPSNQQTPDQIGTPTVTGNIGASGTYYDIAAFAAPTGVRFGNMGRSAIRGPGGKNLDLSIFRAFTMGAARRLELRVEAFNLTNTPTFANPGNDITTTNFMRITALQSGYSERQVRLGVRFAF